MINNHLEQLYKERLSTGNPCFLEQLRTYRRESKYYKPTYPLFLKVDEKKIADADIRIMIFGQETNSWEFKVCDLAVDIHKSHTIIDKTVSVFMDSYAKFFYKERHKSPFWQGIYRINKNMHEQMPTKKIELIWNNVYKIGNMNKNQNRPSDQIIEFQDKHLDVIQNEINIIKPNLLVFLTGHHYDKRISDKFTVSKKYTLCPEINKEELATFSANNLFCYRTYHPNYLRFAKKSYYLDLICADIKDKIRSLNF